MKAICKFPPLFSEFADTELILELHVLLQKGLRWKKMNSRLLDHNPILLTTRPTPRHWSVVVMTSCIFEEDLAHVITHEALLKSIMEGQASFKPSLCMLQTKQVLSQAAQQGFHLFGKSIMLHLHCSNDKLLRKFKKKKAQHPVGFEPTTF